MASLTAATHRPAGLRTGTPPHRPGIFSTAGLARLSAAHPWRVVAAWITVLLLSGVAARGLADALTSQVTMTNKPESVVATDLLKARLRPFEPVTETVVVRSNTATVDDPAFRQVVEGTTAALAGLQGVVASASDYYQAEAGGDPAAAGLVSADRHATLIPVTLVGTFDEAVTHADAYIAAVSDQRRAGYEVLTVGAVSNDHTYGTMAEQDLQHGEAIGVPVALIVLAVVFGALVAPVLPLTLGVVAIVVAFGLTALLGRLMDLSLFVTNVITMLGLAVGIDYSLFIVARYREERQRGASTRGAIELAGGTASKAVLFSGSTVVLALAGMFFVPLTVFRSIGAAAILVVVAAVLATLTLVPAVLALLGDRIDWPRRHRGTPSAIAGPHPTTEDVARARFWSAVTGAVTSRPLVSAGLAVALLGALAVPALDLSRGMATVSSLPPSDTKRAFEILATDFAAGRVAPVEIVVDAKQGDPAAQGAIARLGDALTRDAAFGQAPTVEWNPAGDLALVTVPLKGDPVAPESYAAVKRLRGTLIPAAFGGTGAKVYVTGNTAGTLDFFRAIDRVTPLVFAFVLGLSFLLLMTAFRSIVVAGMAIALNLLSVGAAYGMLVLVFQKGHGADLLGFQQTPTIEAWVPIFLFCILFGLSMDYHVFLLSRIREHYDLTGRNQEAVATGLLTTAKVITGAALIMVVVFGGFAAGRLVQLQELGFGLAVAVFLDATVVRTVLVPAAMELLGDRNWYLPRWLRWLPDIRIEGEPAAWP